MSKDCGHIPVTSVAHQRHEVLLSGPLAEHQFHPTSPGQPPVPEGDLLTLPLYFQPVTVLAQHSVPVLSQLAPVAALACRVEVPVLLCHRDIVPTAVLASLHHPWAEVVRVEQTDHLAALWQNSLVDHVGGQLSQLDEADAVLLKAFLLTLGASLL